MTWWGVLVMLVVRRLWVLEWVFALLAAPLVWAVWAIVQVRVVQASCYLMVRLMVRSMLSLPLLPVVLVPLVVSVMLMVRVVVRLVMARVLLVT